MCVVFFFSEGLSDGLGGDSAGDPAIDLALIKRGIERRIKPDTCRGGTGVDQG